MGCDNELVRGQGEWQWYAGWGVITRVSQILHFDHSLLLICSSWSCTWFLGSRWGLLVSCALEMYSEASIVVTFPCAHRILAEFGMVAFAWCSATSFGVFHIFSAWGWMQEFTFLTSPLTYFFLFIIHKNRKSTRVLK